MPKFNPNNPPTVSPKVQETMVVTIEKSHESPIIVTPNQSDEPWTFEYDGRDPRLKTFFANHPTWDASLLIGNTTTGSTISLLFQLSGQWEIADPRSFTPPANCKYALGAELHQDSVIDTELYSAQTMKMTITIPNKPVLPRDTYELYFFRLLAILPTQNYIAYSQDPSVGIKTGPSGGGEC